MGLDIDLTGENDELPPGVQPGSLGGTDAPAEPLVESDPEAGQFASEEDVPPADIPWNGEIVAGSLGGDDGEEEPAEEPEPDRTIAEAAAAVEPVEEPPVEPEPPEVEPEPEPETPVEPAAEEPKPPPKKRARRKAAAAPKKETQSGAVDRPYLIFEQVQAEVDGNILPVYVQRAFQVDGETITSIVARNRDTALRKAGEFFGHDYEGNLVAVSEGGWDVKPVGNKPEPKYKVTVG